MPLLFILAAYILRKSVRQYRFNVMEVNVSLEHFSKYCQDWPNSGEICAKRPLFFSHSYLKFSSFEDKHFLW